MPSPETPRPRKRKSRFGCRNCKLRHIKCDERKPQCRKCTDYGYVCNYSFHVGDLKLAIEGEKKRPQPNTAVARAAALPPSRVISAEIWCGNGISSFKLDASDRLLFQRFRHRTLDSLGSYPVVQIYENQMLQQSLHYPFLMHAILALTASHDRFLQLSPAQRSLRELHHWSQCTTQFMHWLSRPIADHEKDPCWAAASILGILTTSSVDSSSSTAWPLTDDTSDLEWLRLGASKMMLLDKLNPMRQDSTFRTATENIVKLHERLPSRGAGGVPKQIAALCGLDEDSTAQNNQFFKVAHGLAMLINAGPEDDLHTIVMLSAVNLHVEFDVLLWKKHPVALLLLGIWFNRAQSIKWWVAMRGKRELPAIRTYLKMHHAGDERIRRNMHWIG